MDKLAKILEKERIALIDLPSLIDVKGNRISPSEIARRVIVDSDCPKDFKVLYYKNTYSAKDIILDYFTKVLKIPAKNHLQSIYLSKDYDYCKDKGLVPCVCPQTGIRYFYSVEMDRVVPFEFSKFSKLVNLKLPRIYEVSLQIPLNLGESSDNCLNNGQIYCDDGSPFVFS